MAIPRSSILEELMQPVKIAANCRSSDPNYKVVAHLKSHENCSNSTGSLNVTKYQSKQFLPTSIHEPQNHLSPSPMPNTVEVRAAAASTDSLIVV